MSLTYPTGEFRPSGPGHSRGLVPDPGEVAGDEKYLREDGMWETPAGGSNPMTTLGDTIYGGADGEPTRRAGDTSNVRKFYRELSVAGVATAPVWDALIDTDIPDISATYLTVALAGDIYTYDAADFLPSAGAGDIYTHDASEFQAADSILDTLSALADAAGVLTNNGAGVLSWGAGGGGAHDILSATHSDSTPAAVTRGAQMVGIGAVPTWTIVAAGTANYFWKMGANEPAWFDLFGTANTFTANQTISNASPSLTFTDTTGAAKSLAIAIDSNLAQFRESAGAAGSLMVLDLANLRFGMYGSPTYDFHMEKAKAADGLLIYVKNTANDGWATNAFVNDAGSAVSLVAYGSNYGTAAYRNFVSVLASGASLAGVQYEISGVNKPHIFTINGTEVGRFASSAGQFQLPVSGINAGLSVGSATACQWYQNASDQWRTPNSVWIDDGLGIGKTNLVAGVADALTGFRINGAATSGNLLRGNGTNFVSARITEPDIPNFYAYSELL